MKLHAWAKTDCGRQREHNEDSYLVELDLNLFAIADGMGGHQGGEIASKLAVEVLLRELGDYSDDFASAAADIRRKMHQTRRKTAPYTAVSNPTAILQPEPDSPSNAISGQENGPSVGQDIVVVMEEAVRQAGYTIFDASLRHKHLRGMGTTLTAALFHANMAYLAHAGDSRAYQLRGNSIRQLTEDHSWIQHQVDSGSMTQEEAMQSESKHIITRSVGFERHVEVDTVCIQVKSEDTFLLCSDGLCNYVGSKEMVQLVNTTTNFEELPPKLITLANQRGGDDNITVIVIHVE